jgi:hypothetical protein
VKPSIFLSKSMQHLYRGKKASKNLGYFCNFQKMANVKNRPMSENSPNPVTVFLVNKAAKKISDQSQH